VVVGLEVVAAISIVGPAAELVGLPRSAAGLDISSLATAATSYRSFEDDV
jgi:hypothetical protein